MKKILTILFAVLLLVGCTSKQGIVDSVPTEHSEYDAIGLEYIEKLENFKVRTKSEGNPDDSKFDAFLEQIFIDSMEADYVNMHFTVVDYKSFGITKPEVSWGDIAYGDLSYVDDYIKQYEDLLAFDFDKLSYRQQYDYEALEYSLLETIADSCFERYGLMFTGGNDLMSNLVSNLSDFTFYDKESLDDYLVLIADTDRYIKQALDYTAHQASEGIYLTDYSIDYTKDYIADFTSYIEDNAIIVSTTRSIEALDFLSADEKADYEAKIKDIVINEIIPVYLETSETLEGYRGKTTDEKNALCNINPDYAKLNYYLAYSSNQAVEDVFEDAQYIMDDILIKVMTAVQDDYDALIAELDAIDAGEVGVFGADYRTTLDYLMGKLVERYPDLGVVEYDVEDLSGSAGADTILAYYYQAPIDNLNQNIIRVNPNTMSDDFVETYTTLAHEGMPGHLYQHVFYHQSNPSHMRSVIGFGGYTEGYAIQAEEDALSFSGIENQSTIDYLMYTTVYPYIVLSCADIGVNYFGWDLDTLKTYIDETAYYDPSAASVIYQMMVDMPGTYCHYGLGYVNFHTLRNKSIDALGEGFDYITYNNIISRNGALPFNILAGAVEEYINK